MAEDVETGKSRVREAIEKFKQDYAHFEFNIYVYNSYLLTSSNVV